jgi:hypothetical protein
VTCFAIYDNHVRFLQCPYLVPFDGKRIILKKRVGMNPGSVLREYTFTSLHLRWPPLFVLLDSDRLVHYIIKTHHKFASFPTSWM